MISFIFANTYRLVKFFAGNIEKMREKQPTNRSKRSAAEFGSAFLSMGKYTQYKILIIDIRWDVYFQ